jgi:hypothetical protein
MANDPKPKGPQAWELLSQFIQLRQSGVNRDEAWVHICDSVPGMGEITRKAFLNLAKNWERRDGHQYHYRLQAKVEAQATQPRILVAAVQQALAEQQRAQPLPSRPAPTTPALTGALDPAGWRACEQQRLEKILDQLEDDPCETAPRTPVPAGHRTAPVRPPRDFFGPRTALLMFFKTRQEPIRVTLVGQNEYFIGRATPNAAMSPEIDLNAVNAAQFGVSRMHAAVVRRRNQLLIADLESMNCTYVNGVRLLPQETRVLADGDELWFGQLRCQIRFQHG